MTEQGIIEVLKNEGEVGCTETERYIDLYEGTTTEIKIDDNGGLCEDGTPIIVELAQLVYFGDEDRLCGYFLDEYDQGYFIDFQQFPKNLQEEVLNYDFWHNC